MVSLASHISWTDATWNPTTGCTAVSPGCDNCYAKAMTNRLFGGDFETLKLHPDRLLQARLFGPIRDREGARPRMVFVNSMSDLMHKDVPDEYRDQVFDVMESMPGTVFQVLTKRHQTMIRYIRGRYGSRGVPANIWLGVSVEDNRRTIRLHAMRMLKEAVGEFTAFASVEPLLERLEPSVGFNGFDWVLIGGESGPGARDCLEDAMRRAVDLGMASGAAVWLKQWGKWSNNPLYQAANGPRHIDRVRHAIDAGECMAEIVTDARNVPRVRGEKGGATLDGKTYRALPPAYERMTSRTETLV